MDRVKSQTSSNAAVFGEEWKRFIKMFPTAGAMISTLGIVKESFFTHERDILNNGSTIIMDLFGHRTTVRACVRASFEGKENMDLCIRGGNIFNNNIFQFKELCGKNQK